MDVPSLIPYLDPWDVGLGLSDGQVTKGMPSLQDVIDIDIIM